MEKNCENKKGEMVAWCRGSQRKAEKFSEGPMEARGGWITGNQQHLNFDNDDIIVPLDT